MSFFARLSQSLAALANEDQPKQEIEIVVITSDDEHQGPAERARIINSEDSCKQLEEKLEMQKGYPSPRRKRSTDKASSPLRHSPESDTDTDDGEVSIAPGKRRRVAQQTQATFACQQATGGAVFNRNQHITNELEKLLATYNHGASGGHLTQYKMLGLRKAIANIKRHPSVIESYEDASRIPNVGKETAKKIGEILSTGALKRVQSLLTDDVVATRLFESIWGVGPKTASQLVSGGLRSLADLRKHRELLTSRQLVGLDHHEELSQRIPRAEVAAIGHVVGAALSRVAPGACMEICGSYRRGNIDCGDVDILIAHEDMDPEQLRDKVLKELGESRLITHTLTEHAESNTKLFFVCKLNEHGSLHRMRLLAGTKGMSLSQEGLYAGVLRDPKNRQLKLTSGEYTPTEQSVFEYLGMEYKEPRERDVK